MRLAVIALVAVCSALAVGAPKVRAAARLHTVGPVTSPLAVDGGALAYARSATRVRVIDARLRERAAVATPAGCVWQAIGGGALLWNCASGDALATSGRVYDLASGHVTPLGAAPSRPPGPSGPESTSWEDIGAKWLVASYGGYHYSALAYLGLDGRTSGPSLDRSAVADLDAPGLWRQMCAPLKRRLVPGEEFADTLTLGPFAYRRPYGAARSFRKPFAHPTVILDRCGQQRPRILSHCPRSCSDPVIGDHAVAWIESSDQFDLHPIAARLHVYLIDRRKTLTWRLGRKPATVAILGRRVFVAQSGRLKTVELASAPASPSSHPTRQLQT